MNCSARLFFCYVRRCVSLFLVLLLSFETEAQDKKMKEVDSLLAVSRQQEKAFRLLPMLNYALQGLELADDIAYDHGMGDGHFMVANALANIGVLEEALKHLEAVEETEYYKTQPVKQSEVLRIRGRILTRMGLYQQAVTEFDKQLAFFSKMDNAERLRSELYRYGNLSWLYSLKEDEAKPAADSVIKYSLLQLDLLKKFPADKAAMNFMNVYTDLGWAYVSLDEYDKAEDALDKALAWVDKHKLHAYFNTTKVYGELELRRGNYSQAKKYFACMLVNIQEVGDRDALLDQYENLAKLYRQYKLNSDTANMYLMKASLLRDTLNRENQKLIDTALNYVLKNKNKERKENRQILWYALSIGFIVLVLISWLAYLAWKGRKSHEILAKKEYILRLEKSINSELQDTLQQNKFEKLLELAKDNNPEFLTLFTELYPDFIAALKAHNSKIRNTELEFCAMAYLNFSTKNIAEYTFVTIRAVQIRKNRLRKKFNIPSEIDFNSWMQKLGSKQ